MCTFLRVLIADIGQEHVITGLSMKPLHLNLGGFNGGIYKLSALDSEFEDENRAGPGHVIKLVDLHQEYASVRAICSSGA